jgi:AAA family ATP:ADP antiporter
MNYTFSGVHVRNRQEAFMLAVTSLQSVLSGAFISLFFIGSHVLFLQSWVPENLPHAFILSGIVGTLLFSVYSYFNSRINFRVSTALWLLFLTVVNAGLFFFYDNIFHLSVLNIPLMLPFTLCIPFLFLVTLLLRRSTLDLFTPGQHRRFYGMIRTSFVAGIIGASYALVPAFYFEWDIMLILGASAGSIMLTFLLQLVINQHHHSSGAFPQPKRISPLRSKFWELFYTRYTLMLLAFVVLSSVVGYMVHYHFIVETRLNYSNEIGLARFFGFFTGTMFLFVLLVEKILVRKILYAYDSPFSLVLIPAVLLLACIASLVVDVLIGQSNAFARFSFAFLMVAILKIGYETTFESIETPSLRVLFRTLDLRFLSSVKVRLEGTMRMVSMIIAGLLLSGMVWLNLNKSLHQNLIVLIFTGIWLPVGIFLIRGYQQSLRDYIRRLKASKRTIGQDMLNIDEKSHFLINSSDPVKSVNTLSVIERLEPLTHEKHLVSLLGTESVTLRKYLLERIDENALLSSLPHLKELQQVDHQKQQNGYLTKLVNRFEIKLHAGSTRHAIEMIMNSHTLTDRILAAEIIGNSDNHDYADYLLQLSRDFEPEVKLASIKAMARLGHAAHSYVLIGYLTTPYYYPYASEALVKIGDPALPFMEESFLLPDADNTLLLRIVRIYGKIGSQAAIDSLLGKIENQNKAISRQALLALREAKFQSSPGNINRILNDIVRLINVMSWNFGAYSSIISHKEFPALSSALFAEIKDNYETLYHLLALAYNPTSIGNIKMMLNEGNDTDISFAIELLDQIVNEEIKQVFFPVVENITINERFRQLQYFFQSVKETPENLIQEIITRDFNQISLYVKACAIDSMLKLNRKEAGQEIIASIFHPNQLIRETAAYILYKIEPETLESVYSRLSPDRVVELRSVMGHLNDPIPYLLLDRIRFIKNCRPLRNISEDVLLEISRTLVVHQINTNEEFLVKREDVHFAFMIVIDGQVQINNSSGKVFTFGKNDIIYSDILVADSTYSFKALTDIRFYSLEQEVLNALMFDYLDFRDTILEIIEKA